MSGMSGMPSVTAGGPMSMPSAPVSAPSAPASAPVVPPPVVSLLALIEWYTSNPENQDSLSARSASVSCCDSNCCWACACACYSSTRYTCRNCWRGYAYLAQLWSGSGWIGLGLDYVLVPPHVGSRLDKRTRGWAIEEATSGCMVPGGIRCRWRIYRV
jgi:hypothetical protein